MPEGYFPQEDEEVKRERELLRQKLEDSIEVRVDPVISLETLLLFVKNKKMIMFILDSNFRLFLTPGEHRYLLGRLDIETKDCLISSGTFQIKSDEKISFWYSHELGPVISIIPEIAQTKIKQFLKSQGIEITN